jgi:rubrerythrin
MKKVFVSQNLVEVEMRKDRLEQAGIQCMIKNQRASGLAGEIPFAEVFPEVWVLHDQDYDKAQQLIEDETVALQSSQGHWTCHGCGERHENQFGACWKCGQDKLPA